MEKRRAQTLAAVCGLLSVLCIVFFTIAILLRPRTYTSHHDVVVDMVQQRGYTIVTYSSSLKWPEGVNYYAYGSGVYPYSPTIYIRLEDSREIDGMIECQNDKYNCRLTLSELGIEREIMPDIQKQPRYRGPPWLRRLFDYLDVTL